MTTLNTCVRMLLSKPASHGVRLCGGGQGGAEAGARVESVAEILVTSAHSLVVMTVRLVS